MTRTILFLPFDQASFMIHSYSRAWASNLGVWYRRTKIEEALGFFAFATVLWKHRWKPPRHFDSEFITDRDITILSNLWYVV